MARLGKIPKNLRQQAIERDGQHCVYVPCDQSNLDVHHVRWISRGGTHELANLATLCKNHHDTIHRDTYSEQYVRKLVSINMAIRKMELRSLKYPRRITRIDDPDLKAAMELYQSEFPEEERDSPEDIKRWIGEAAGLRNFAEWLIAQRNDILNLRVSDIPGDVLPPEDLDEIKRHFRALRKLTDRQDEYEQYIKENIQQMEEYIWVHRRKGRLCGYLYYEYYYDYKLAFIDYLVSKNVDATYEMLGKCLLNRIRKEHPECEGIIAELEDPTHVHIEYRNKARARLRLFCHRWGIHVIKGAAYRQPKLNLSNKSMEIPMILLYYPLQPLKTNKLPKRRFKKILDFVLDSVYGGSFETQESNEQYRKYLLQVKECILSESHYPLRLTTLSGGW